MKDLKLWRFMLEQMKQNKPMVFLCVLESTGSSPGRQGFKMAVSNLEINGSIGGGIMEHKFVEFAKELLKQNSNETLVKQQIHSKLPGEDQSGMICSGEQTIAIYRIKPIDILIIQKIIETIEENCNAFFELNSTGLKFIDKLYESKEITFNKISDSDWRYTEKIGYINHLHIIGGGHVSLAFSKLMKELDFFITIYDDRPELNTLQQNEFANLKQFVDYEKINTLIPEGKNQYVVIMTFGYRSDGVVIRKLLGKNFRYLGLLGSETKAKKILSELITEGFDSSTIKAIHAPIGIQIKSQTPEEIAISIAAEIIQEKNR